MIGKKDSCFLCGQNGGFSGLERHHIFFGKNRKNSEKYDVTVMLCGDKCHRNGPFSAHKDKITDLFLKRCGQQWAMQEYGWSTDDFIKIFGKNYL